MKGGVLTPLRPDPPHPQPLSRAHSASLRSRERGACSGENFHKNFQSLIENASIIKNSEIVYIYYDGPRLVTKARELRRTQTKAEKILWEQVRNRQLGGYKIRRQQVLNEIIVDFYCTEKRLCIEIDGPYHNEPITKGLDQQRDNELKAHGFVVQRYSNDQVIFDLQAVLADMLNLLETLRSEKRRFLNHNPHIDLGHDALDNNDKV